jgi:hypothetical protein
MSTKRAGRLYYLQEDRAFLKLRSACTLTQPDHLQHGQHSKQIGMWSRLVAWRRKELHHHNLTIGCALTCVQDGARKAQDEQHPHYLKKVQSVALVKEAFEHTLLVACPGWPRCLVLGGHQFAADHKKTSCNKGQCTFNKPLKWCLEHSLLKGERPKHRTFHFQTQS